MTESTTHTAAPLCFVDCETDSLRPDRAMWEYAVIRRNPNGQEVRRHVVIGDVDLTHADPYSLKLNHFYERHPRFGGVAAPAETVDEQGAALLLEDITRGAHIVGCVPSFDVECFKRLLGKYGLPWTGHYHLIDVENLAVGYLAGKPALELPEGVEPYTSLQPPWNSEHLSRLLGVEPPSPEERHTALGDALWAMRLYDRITQR